MKHKTKSIDTYTPNKNVLVTVTHTPIFEDDTLVAYNRTVTIKVKAGRDKQKLEFKKEDGIAKFIETVDFEDPQQELGV